PEEPAADVLEHAHAGEDRRDLEAAREAAPGDLVRVQSVDAAAVQLDAAGGEREAAADQVEERGLARPVRSDDGVARAGGHVEAHAHDNSGGAGDILHVDQAQGGGGHARIPAALISSTTASPASANPPAAWRSQRTPPTSTNTATAHGSGVRGSMVTRDRVKLLPCAAPMVRNEHSSTTSTKPTTTRRPGSRSRREGPTRGSGGRVRGVGAGEAAEPAGPPDRLVHHHEAADAAGGEGDHEDEEHAR